jgi:tetratricopeptide (TPR) repeat protein
VFIEKNYSWRAWKGKLLLLPLFIFILAVFYPFSNKSWFFLSLILLNVIVVGYCLYKWKKSSVAPAVSLVDWVFIALLVYEIINFYVSQYPPNSFFYLERIFSFGILYFLLKLYGNQQKLIDLLVLLISIVGLVLALINVQYFISFYSNNKSLVNLADYKYLYKPLGINSNELATIFLCLLPFPAWFVVKFKNIFVRSFFTLIIALMLFGVLTTFSRGVYIALGLWVLSVFTLLYFFKVLKLSETVKVLFVFIVVFLIASLPVYKPVVTTLAMEKTLSQKLSTEGRKELYNTGFQVFKDHLLTGIGSNNFPLKYAVYKRQSDDVKFNGNVTNSFLLVLIEKGVIGFCLYGSLFLIILINAFRKLISADDRKSKGTLIIFLCSLLAILTREIFYASIFINDYALFLCVIIMYVCEHNHHGKSLRLFNNSTAATAYFLLLIMSLAILYPFAGRDIAKGYYSKAIEMYKNDNYDKSLQYFQQSVKYDRGNAIYQAYTALTIVKRSIHGVSVEDVLQPSYKFNPSYNSTIDSALQCYLQAIRLNEDDIFIHNAGWLYLIKGENDQAAACFKRAIRIDPGVALYHISLGLVQEKKLQPDSALQEYAKAVRLSPDLLDSDFFRSLKVRSPGIAIKVILLAQRELENFLMDHHDVKIQAKLAKVYMHNGREQEAYNLLKQITEQLPNLNRPHLYLGDIYAIRGDTSRMLECYYVGAKTDPNDFLSDVRLLNYYKALKDSTKANNFYKSGYYKWSTIFPEYATKTAIVYRLKRSIHNAIIPQDMLQYIKSFPLQ